MKLEDIERIKKGIAGYAHEQAVLLRLLRKRGQFTQHEFDEWFYRKSAQLRHIGKSGICGDNFMLGLGINGLNYWSEMLELMQKMMAIGLIDARTENGIVIYRLGEQHES